jgi:sugar lactone lactonase YvrE
VHSGTTDGSYAIKASGSAFWTPAKQTDRILADPKGKKLGRIVHGRPETTNIAFGGDDW